MNMEQNQQPQPPVFNPQQPPQPVAQQYQPRVTASPTMDPVTAVKTCLKKYFDFKGRARRSEFWWFMLFVFVVSSMLSLLFMALPAISYVSMAFTLAMIIPMLAALCRRLHDTNHGGWWVALLAVFMAGYYGSTFAMIGTSFTDMASSTNASEIMSYAEDIANSVMANPVLSTIMVVCSMCTLILGLVLLIFSLFDSNWGENKYGPSPKYS